MLYQILILFCLLFLFYQDWRFRAVYWVTFPVLFTLLLASCFEQLTWADVSEKLLFNLGFLLLQLFFLSLYFSIKNRRLVNITEAYLGWGDILFLVCLSFYLSPLNYLFFFLTTLFLVAAYALILLYRHGRKDLQIPLAGLQSLFFILFLVTDWNSSAITLQNDSWLLNYLGA